MLVSVLAEMWGVNGKSAKCIADLFSSMSLGKASELENAEGVLEAGLRIHDLHHDFCCEQAQVQLSTEKRHFRLLRGEMPLLTGSRRKELEFSTNQKDFIGHSSQAWYSEDLRNTQYLREKHDKPSS